jgi:hypothetical protein
MPITGAGKASVGMGVGVLLVTRINSTLKIMIDATNSVKEISGDIPNADTATKAKKTPLATMNPTPGRLTFGAGR